MKNRMLSLIWLVAALSVSIVGCKDDEPTLPSVSLKDDPILGKILVDRKGKALYYFSKDTYGVSNCTGNCLASWPIFYEEHLTVSTDLNMDDFATINTSAGEQITYKGLPLYYYVGDTHEGDVKGEAADQVWYVAKPDYSLFYQYLQLKGHDEKSYLANYTLAPYVEGQGLTFFLTDGAGRTLYTFKNDRNGVNNFGGNTSVWPAFYADPNTLVLPSIFSRSNFGEITKNGVKQLTFKGWPLYYFGGNANATPPVAGDVYNGETRGVSFPTPGTFPIANALTTTAPN